uniref:Uncharacterized protein n=1 Tax=Tetranychus urticae TaxID=32264 RepID=T1KML2_TETUR
MDIKPTNGQLNFLRLRRPPFNFPSISNPTPNPNPNPIPNPISGSNVLPVQQPLDPAKLMSQMVNFSKMLSTAAEAPVNNGTSPEDVKARAMAQVAKIYKPVIDKGLHKAADFDKGLMNLLKGYLGDIFDDATEGAYRTVDKLTGTEQSSTS